METFEADGLTVDFVGSTSGPDSLGDKDHEGHPVRQSIGLTLKRQVAEHLAPDIVTLIIGTNDTGRGYSIRKMSSDLSGLIEITQQLPDTTACGLNPAD